MNKIIFTFLGTFLIVLWIGVGMLFAEKFRDSGFPPKPTFIMDDKDAFYTITKDDLYFVSYFKSKEATSTPTTSILVGNSPIDLDPYIGKSLKITGWFKDTYGYRQCVVDSCRELQTKSVVIDITKIELKN